MILANLVNLNTSMSESRTDVVFLGSNFETNSTFIYYILFKILEMTFVSQIELIS